MDQRKNSAYAIFIIWICLLTCLVPGGFHQAAMNPLLPILRSFINQTYLHRYDAPASPEIVNLYINLAQSFLIAGTAAGSLSSRHLIDRFSRRTNFVLIHALLCFGAVLMAPIAYFGRTFEAFVAGRFVIGFGRGVFVVLAPLTMAETSHRWSYVTYQNLHPVMGNGAFIVANALGLPEALGTDRLWPVMVCVPAFLSLVFFAALPWFPNSVTWQLFQERKCLHHQPAEMTRRSSYVLLRKLRCTSDDGCMDEYHTKIKEIEDDARFNSMSFRQVLSSVHYRRQLVCTVVVRMGMQVAGIQILSQYTNTLFESAGIDPGQATYYTIGVFGFLGVMILLSSPLAGRFGSRTMFIAGQSVIVVGYAMLIVATEALAAGAKSTVGVIALFVVVLGMAVGSALAISTLPSQLTTQATRAFVLSVAVTTFFVNGTIITFVTPYAIAAWNGLAYIPFMFFTLVTVVFALFFVPETHKKTSEEIQFFFKEHGKHAVLPGLIGGRVQNHGSMETTEFYDNPVAAATEPDHVG